MSSNSSKSYPNRLGLKGWGYAGRYSFERYLYIGHRLSGIGLIAYMVLHIIETANRFAAIQSNRVFAFRRGRFSCNEWRASIAHRVRILSWEAQGSYLPVFNIRNETPPADICHYGTGWVDHYSWWFEFVL